MSAVWTVAKVTMSRVAASSPVAQVNVSNDVPCRSVRPPYPCQRATGSRNSMPASSASRAASRLSSQAAMPDTPSSHDAAATPSVSSGDLAIFELQKPFVEPMLRMCRLTNTALDILFYDVGVLTAALLAKGRTIDTGVSANLASAPHPLA